MTGASKYDKVSMLALQCIASKKIVPMYFTDGTHKQSMSQEGRRKYLFSEHSPFMSRKESVIEAFSGSRTTNVR